MNLAVNTIERETSFTFFQIILILFHATRMCSLRMLAARHARSRTDDPLVTSVDKD